MVEECRKSVNILFEEVSPIDRPISRLCRFLGTRINNRLKVDSGNTHPDILKECHDVLFKF